MRRVAFIVALLPIMGCASLQRFLEADDARVRSWRMGEIETESVCVIVGDECVYVPGEVYAAEKPAIDVAAHQAHKSWRENRPHAADLVTAR